jgi:hypothetical protein
VSEARAVRQREAEASNTAILRLVRYARPDVGAILVAIVLASVFSAGRYGRAYLVKPIFDDVIAPSQVLREAGGTLPLSIGEILPGVGDFVPTEPTPETSAPAGAGASEA